MLIMFYNQNAKYLVFWRVAELGVGPGGLACGGGAGRIVVGHGDLLLYLLVTVIQVEWLRLILQLEVLEIIPLV